MNNFCINRLFTVLLIGFLVACSSPINDSASNFYKGVDSYQREVSLEKEPQRIISLSPGITEMIYLLNAEEKLVGVSDFCDYPPQTEHLTKVGGLQNINVESLLTLHPDLVLIGSIVSKEDVTAIEAAGIPIIAIKEENKIEGISDALEVLGAILNRKEKSEQMIESIEMKLSDLKKNISGSHDKKVYYVVGFGDSGDFTAPRNSHIHEIITLAGGDNIGKELTTWGISREYLFEQNPDIIIVRKEDLDHFKNMYPYNRLDAVKNGKVYPIESGWIDNVSPRNIDAALYIHKLINDGSN